MKKEYIMSEEDKELKRIKIEQNRNKRKLKVNFEKAASSGDDQDQDQVVITKKSIKVKKEWSPGSSSAMETQSESSINNDSDESTEITSSSSAAEILEAITKNVSKSSQIIQKVMKTQHEAVEVMSRLIQEPSLALILISHLIKNPADGMLIISKMMSSPLDALSVFTQFMASPTDALQMIFKIMSSPKDVMQFMSDLAQAPHESKEVMKRFRSNQGDSLNGLTRILRQSMSSESQTNEDSNNDMIKTILEVSSVDSPNSSVDSLSSAFQSARTPNSPQVVPSDYDVNNNNYHQDTSKMLNEIYEDINNSPYQNNSIDSIINEAIKLEYETPQTASQMAAPNRDLIDIEVYKIQELVDSNKALYAPVDEDMTALMFGCSQIKTEPGIDPMLMRVINLTAVAIRRLIKMSKKISGFKKMCQEDQIALLKVICVSSQISQT